MNDVRRRASVAPSTITRLSRGEVSERRIPRRTQQRQRLLAVRDEYAVRIDPRVMAVLHEQRIDFRYVEVVSATEVIIHNQRVR